MGPISHVSNSLLFSAQFVVVEKHTYVMSSHAVLSVELPLPLTSLPGRDAMNCPVKLQGRAELYLAC